MVILGGLIVLSLSVGGYDITVAKLVSGSGVDTGAAAEAWNMFFISRVPRTAALVLAAVAMSFSGVIMQLITQNAFVEPTTVGTSAWAGLGFLVSLIVFPSAPVLVKMSTATAFALAGTLLFLLVVRRLSLRTTVIVPIVGIMLGAVVGSVTSYVAISANLLQTLTAWRSGGFSGIVRGQYEPLWAVAAVAVVAYLLADRFTVAGLGKDVATNVGLRYERVVFLGCALVAAATGVTSVVVGFLPFLGLVVPNIVRIGLGDDLRRNLPWVAVLGAILILACDTVGRVVVAPLEVPVSLVLGVVGSAVFILLVLRMRRRALA
ncbi:iron chelate uptake ABC transporter family permease subunit [Leifsonia lichenia]